MHNAGCRYSGTDVSSIQIGDPHMHDPLAPRLFIEAAVCIDRGVCGTQ